MNPSEVSRTALAAALTRAVRSRADPAPLLDDAWGDRLIPDFVRDAFGQGALDRMDPDTRAKAQLALPQSSLDRVLRANAAYADIVIRARYAESDFLHFIAADLSAEGLQTALGVRRSTRTRASFVLMR